MGIQGGPAVTLCCAVAEGVANVELRNEDGERTELEPVGAFLLYVIPPKHYPRGHRLEAVVWRDASAREVASRTVETNRPGIYPCSKKEERELGYGHTICP